MATNAFPVIRPIVEKYDTTSTSPAKHTLTAEFFGYRAKEDLTALPPGYLVQPSQNVLHLASGLIYSRPGYTLDGQAAISQNVLDPIQSSYDWVTHLGTEQHLRVHNGAMEFRWVNSTGAVSWLPLMTQNTMHLWDGVTGLFRFAEYWDSTEDIDQLLFVNGDGNVYSWGGAVATLASVSSSALTVTSGLYNAPSGEVIEIIGSSQLTSFSGSTTTAGNYVLSSTITVNGATTIVGYIVIANQPAPNDTLTLVVNGASYTFTFISHPYGGLVAAGYGQGTVGIGYDWIAHTGYNGNIYLYTPNLSSPNVNITRAYLLQALLNSTSDPGANFSNFVPFAAGNNLALLNFNTQPIITGSTTTAGNTVTTDPLGETLVFSMLNNPNNGDIVTLDLNGQSIVSTAVSVISGAPAGSFLIGMNAAATMTNFLGLLQAPTTTNSTQTAYSALNALLIGVYKYGVSTGITLKGNQSWADLGFMTGTGGRGVVIQGQVFVYTGGEATQTLTGVSPDPTSTPLPALVAGLPVVQAVMAYPWTGVTNLPDGSAGADFNPNLIASLGIDNGNQIFYGNTQSRKFYLSATNNPYDFTLGSPRIPSNGQMFFGPSATTAFVPQETTMYVSSGPDWWSTIQFGPQQQMSVTVSGTQVTTTYEPCILLPLKTSPGQGAQTQESVFKVKNSVFVLTNEPAIDDLGRIIDDLALPEAQTLTDSIKNNFLNYNFTGCYGLYAKYFLYIVLPEENTMLVYNFFQAWWEPPQVFGFSRLSLINGDLYAHSDSIPETYRVFIDNPLDPEVVYSDNGNPINCIAAFSYNNFGTRDVKKQFTELYVEGYIQPNTTLTCASKFDFGGYSGTQTYSLSGALQNNLIYTYADNSLGKVPLGKNPIGSITDSISNTPKFRHIFRGINVDFFEYQPYFQSNDIDQQWQLLALAVNQQPSDSNTLSITT